MKMAAVSPTMLAVLTIGVGALILGIMIGLYTMPVMLTPEINEKLSTLHRLTKEYYSAHDSTDPVYRALIDDPKTDKIAKTLEFLSFEPHQAGTDRDAILAAHFEQSFRKFGFDRVHRHTYEVLLSYADRTRPNKIYVLDEATNEASVMTAHIESPISAHEMHPNAVHAYAAYSPKGDVSGQPVYCNYGRNVDFETLLDEARIDVRDKICIIRYGKIYRGNKVHNAASRGCKAVILFSDPSLIALNGTDTAAVYPHSIWMNGKAIQRGNIGLVSGDPLSEGFPSIKGSFRYDETSDRVRLPKIPTQPIGYDDAKAILEQMSGIDTQANIKFRDWTGGLNITYRLGPGFMSETKTLRIVVNNELLRRNITNVIGIIEGDLEPNRYVIVGNHRDAWGYGAMDAASGGAAMLESARIFAAVRNRTGWRPRRSLVFASWSAEELGLIGSTEWTEEWRHLLATDAVSYLNVDTCVSGPRFAPDASPSLMQVLRDAVRRVPVTKANMENEFRELNQTLYDTWIAEQRTAATTSPNVDRDKVNVEKISSGSDQVPFTFMLGIPSINLEFKPDKRKQPVPSYPAYHTGYETINLVKNYIDPNFEIHRTCSQTISVLLYALSCSTIIPIRMDELGEIVQRDYERENLRHMLRAKWRGPEQPDLAAIEFAESSMQEFVNATIEWQRRINAQSNVAENETQSFANDPYAVRRINDVAIRVERLFAENAGRPLYRRPDTRNLLIGTPHDDFYQTVIMPGVHDLLREIREAELAKSRGITWNHDELRDIQTQLRSLQQELKRHLSDVAIAFRAAARLLRENAL